MFFVFDQRGNERATERGNEGKRESDRDSVGGKRERDRVSMERETSWRKEKRRENEAPHCLDIHG